MNTKTEPLPHPQDDETVDDEQSILERLATLEERTRPKKPGLVDNIKAWGGVASLVIALAYSFPLGLWDRFVVSPEQSKAQELQGLRDVISTATNIILKNAEAMTGISDPQMRDQASRAATTQMYLLMQKNGQAFINRKNDFVPAEALVIGNNFMIVNQYASAIEFFEHAQAIAGEDVLSKIEASRMLGKARFFPGPSQDLNAARTSFREGLKLGDNNANFQVQGAILTLYTEWGLLEHQLGDWKCGKENIAVARQMYAQYETVINDQGNLLKIIEAQIGSLQRQVNQPALGCA